MDKGLAMEAMFRVKQGGRISKMGFENEAQTWHMYFFKFKNITLWFVFLFCLLGSEKYVF